MAAFCVEFLCLERVFVMAYLRRKMVGSLGLLFCFSGVLSAQQSTTIPPVSPPAVDVSPVAKQAATNDVADTNDMKSVWSQFPTAVEAPGTHHLTTNATGGLVHHFNMQPVVTNMTALTNDLLVLERKVGLLEQEMKDLPQRANILRDAWMQDIKILSNISSNFVPSDAEGKKIKERMDALEKELKPLHEEMKKRLLADSEFQKAKAKLDEDAAAFKVIQDRKAKIREERGALTPQIWALNELKKRELSKPASKVEPKAVAP